MSWASFFLRTALHHLRRGEQRTAAALLCITFGVMALVSMTLVAHALGSALAVTPAELFGADLSLNRRQEDYLSPEHVAELEALRAAGQLSRVTLVAHTNSLVYRLPASGELRFVNAGLGIDPAVYPLAGRLVVGLPAGATAASLLQAPGDVLVTRDLAAASGLRVGDPLILSDLEHGAPVSAAVRGILFDTPNHQGSRLYYSVATAQELAGRERALNVALALTPHAEALAEALPASGWAAYPAAAVARANAQTRALMDLLLKGAGLLGLLVSGIGIASTMQVLLRRRQREIAVWKTLGYGEAHLQALFAAEAGLLGLAGSGIGAALGVAVSHGLLAALGRAGAGSWLLDWSFSPWPVLTGALAGVAATAIFALWAIVRTAGVAPTALLRGEAVTAGTLSWPRTLALALGLALPFTALTSWVMGSPAAGIGVLLFALGGLAGLGGLLGGLAWAVVRFLRWLPPSLPLVRLAQASLRRRGSGLVFGMIALFTGIVALAGAVVVTQNGQREMAKRTLTLDGFELTALAPAGEEAALRAAVAAAGLAAPEIAYQTSVERIRVLGEFANAYVAPLLIGRAAPGDYALSGAPWGSDAEGVYANGFSGLPAGARVEVTPWEGPARTLTIVGAYNLDAGNPQRALGLLLPASLSQALAPPATVQLDLDVPPGQAAALSARLGRALPGATVINRVAYATRYLEAHRNLFVLAVAMSALALLAGVLLVANAVSLAMLDRRYEIAVLKAMGYTRAHLLAALAVEYGLVGAIASGAALAAMQMMLWTLAAANDLAAGLLALEPGMAGLIGLIELTVVAATWGVAGASPAVMLYDRE